MRVQADPLRSPRWNRLSEIIAARTGLHFPPERRADLRRALGHAAADFGLADGDSCADWLLTSSVSAEDLARLIRHITIGETYFFRERPSFDALASHVLPLLIQRRRHGDRRLRLWSAACSTGEEPYSLAMLIQQVLPDWREWQIRILATDINPQVLEKAEAGVYGEWSFRECAPELRERFFSPVGNRRHRVRADVRDMVRFAPLNLSQGAFPSPANDTQEMDVILCRNLLIYFTPSHARRLIVNLRQCLVEGGWLVVSPSECSQTLFKGFEPVNFPGSILYRKREALVADMSAGFFPASEADTPVPCATLNEREVAALLSAPQATAVPIALENSADSPRAAGAKLADAQALYADGQYADAAAVLSSLIAHSTAPPVDALALLTRALANQGHLEEALAASRRWLAADKLDAAAHYLNAMVLQELGDRRQSRAALQRAVYLQPDFALAHFALGNHARAEARGADAHRHFENAAGSLRGHADDELPAESEGLTAGRLREIIAALTSSPDT